MTIQDLGRGIVKRSEKRVLGLFIDGTGLDRATRRLQRKVEMSLLVKSLIAGANLVVARYYTIIPYEDDSRQRAFLDAVSRAGLQVIVKRLPPVGITRQVAVDVEMAADMLAFSLGHQKFSSLSEYKGGSSAPSLHHAAEQHAAERSAAEQSASLANPAQAAEGTSESTSDDKRPVKRILTVVCPSRDLAYPMSLAKELGVDTVSADFGEFAGQDVLKSAAKWIDLGGSETIWRDSK